jgi:molecular chaperone DnaJ
MKNYYSILGVNKNSSVDEIKKAFRKLALENHPDKNPGDKIAEERFKDIAEAYDVLSDPEKKSKYDKPDPFYGSFSGSKKSENPYDEWARKSGNTSKNSRTEWDGFVNFDEFFQNGFTTRKRSKHKKGPSISITVPMSLPDMLSGITKKIKLKRTVKCGECGGNGALDGASFLTCPKCSGQGWVTRVEDIGTGKKSMCTNCTGTGKMVLEKCFKCEGKNTEVIEDIIEIKIPAGSIAGMQFVIDGKGHESEDSTEPGDLIVFIKDDIDPEFIRSGTNLRVIREISIPDAIGGCKIKVRMPSGENIQTIVEPGTTHGTVLQFPGKGIPDLGLGSHGDFLVEIRIKIPKLVDKEDYDFLELMKNNKIFNNG